LILSLHDFFFDARMVERRMSKCGFNFLYFPQLARKKFAKNVINCTKHIDSKEATFLKSLLPPELDTRLT
jgi:hypothetical protein